MSLQDIEHKDRIIFLELFVKEIINAVKECQDSKKRIEVEKLRQKFIEKKINPNEAMRQVIKSPLTQSNPDEINSNKSRIQLKEIKSTNPLQKSISASFTNPIENKQQITQVQPPIQPIPQKTINQEDIKKEILNSVSPAIEKRPTNLGLGKMTQLLNDKSIQAIECTGPEKNLLIKRYNQINASSVLLSQEEIETIIQEFSRQAKIPIIGGLFKAAVGDMIISAIISEVVGSRFIINKITPYSLIYNQEIFPK